MPPLFAGITGAIFQRYLSVTHCPLIHQQPSKQKHSLWVFISGCFDIHICHIWGRHGCLYKDDEGKGHLFYKIWTFLTNILSTKIGDKPLWIDVWRGLVWPDYCVCVISNYPNGRADTPWFGVWACVRVVVGCVWGRKEEKEFAESSIDESVWRLVSDMLLFQPESRLRWL